jgi:signal peptidase II
MVNKTFLIAFIIIILDRITKFVFFDSSKINSGAAFNILPGWNWLFIVVALAVSIYIINHRNYKEYQLGMGLLLGGTLGNLIDRIFYTGVIDFISISIIPTFNISDLANVLGAIIIIYTMYSAVPKN